MATGASMLRSINRGHVAFLFAVALSVLVAPGCAATASSTTGESQPTAESQNLSNDKVIGEWDGGTIAACLGFMRNGRCNARNNVSFSIVQNTKNQLVGNYTCSYGNQTCLLQNTTGKVPVITLHGNFISMRVIMSDGTSCLYSARIQGSSMRGGYTCGSGARLFEQGSFTAQKAF